MIEFLNLLVLASMEMNHLVDSRLEAHAEKRLVKRVGTVTKLMLLHRQILFSLAIAAIAVLINPDADFS